jgi:DNA-binding NarL/FixJ family response regulator
LYIKVVLAISILLQITATVLALKLIKITGRNISWILVAVAISLMAIRRSVTLFHISMPKKTGIEVLRELKAQGNKIPVPILSTYSMEECGERAIREGADGFLSKEDAPEKLIDAIRKVSQDK